VGLIIFMATKKTVKTTKQEVQAVPVLKKSFNDRFVEDLLSEDFLDNAIQWIKENLEINDVFDEDDIIEFAESYGMIDPNNEDEMAEWAASNGYEKNSFWY